MLVFDFQTIHPDRSGHFRDQVSSCCQKLSQGKCDTCASLIRIAVYYDIDAVSPEQIKSAFNHEFSARWDFSNVPLIFIAQKPDFGEVAVETLRVSSVDGKNRVEYGNKDGLRYAIYSGGDSKLAYFSTFGDTNSYDDLLSRLVSAGNLLMRNGLKVSDIIRQWAYIGKITENSVFNGIDAQNYQIFNLIRKQFYSEKEFSNGFPAATGIGQKSNEITVELLALKGGNVIPISNPRQINAFKYSDRVLSGEVKPLFERGKILRYGNGGYLLVSGTASIKGEDTEGVDIEKQTLLTIENIEALFSSKNLKMHNSDDLSFLRYKSVKVYLKRYDLKEEIQNIILSKMQCRSVSFFEADICRPDLLVEIECIVELEVKMCVE